MSTTITTLLPHPYYPSGLILSGSDFTRNTSSVLSLISSFALIWALILGSTLLFIRRVNPLLTISDQCLVLWFTLCTSPQKPMSHKMKINLMYKTAGCIHVFFEGYFMFNHSRMASMSDFFGQLWKEYALSDSRYMVSDPFVLVMESYTCVCPQSPSCNYTSNGHSSSGVPSASFSLP